MKKQTLFLFLPIFLIFFIWGLQIGDQFNEKSDQDSINRNQFEKEINVLPNGQKTILIIIASTMESHDTELLGIWLMTYSSNEPYTTVIPLYPTFSPNGINIYDSLIESFELKRINTITTLNDAFVTELEKVNISYSGYVIMDLDGFAEAIELSGGLKYISENKEDVDKIEQLSRRLKDPNSSNTYQTLLFQQLCNRFADVNLLPDLIALRNLFPDHISGNINPDTLMKDWQEFITAKHGSFCIFPQTEQTTQLDD